MIRLVRPAVGCLLLSVPFVPLGAQATPPASVAIERQLAGQLGLSVGDTFRLATAADPLGSLFTVGAVYEPSADPAEIAKRERHLRLHLADLARLLRTPDRVDRLSIGLYPGISADSAAAVLNRTAYGYRVYSAKAIASESSQTFLVVSRFHRAIAVITIVASAVFLLCIMLLKVEERRLDAAVMRFVGVRRRTIFLALLFEALLVAGLGSLFGVGLAYLAGAATNAYYRRFFDTALTFSLITPDIVTFSVMLSLVLGALAGGVAAWRLVQTRPVVLWARG
jgi:putative ABC transport system permease protein